MKVKVINIGKFSFVNRDKLCNLFNDYEQLQKKHDELERAYLFIRAKLNRVCGTGH